MISSHSQRSFAQIGVGNLGSAIIDSLLRTETVRKENCTLIVRRSEQQESLRAKFGTHVETSIERGAAHAETILLAMKPQQAADVLRSLAPVVRERTEKAVVISVAAGISDKTIRDALGGNVEVACVLPNLLIGGSYSAVGLFAPEAMAAARSTELFSPLARVFKVDRLEQLDVVSAISASLPGQLAMILRGIVLGAVQQGLTETMARELILLASAGTAARLIETKQSLSDFADRVCTPGGTTITGVRELMDGAVDSSLMKMVESTARRAREFRAMYGTIDGTLPPIPRDKEKK